MMTCYPATAPVRTAEPTLAQEPVTVAEARRQCNLGDGITYHDEELASLIVSSRREVEHDASLTFYTGAHTWLITSFPSQDWLEIPNIRPVTAIGSIAYIDTAGDSQTWDSSNYNLEQFHKVAVIALAYDADWPTVRGDMNGITITLTAGYSTVVAMPPEAKQAVRLALHVKWLLKMEQFEQAERQQQGYERQIELIRRDIYA